MGLVIFLLHAVDLVHYFYFKFLKKPLHILSTFSGKLQLVVLIKGGVRMNSSKNNEPTKAEVQTTKLNKLPLVGKFDPEFSAEEAAEVFENQPSADSQSNHKQ